MDNILKNLKNGDLFYVACATLKSKTIHIFEVSFNSGLYILTTDGVRIYENDFIDFQYFDNKITKAFIKIEDADRALLCFMDKLISVKFNEFNNIRKLIDKSIKIRNSKPIIRRGK